MNNYLTRHLFLEFSIGNVNYMLYSMRNSKHARDDGIKQLNNFLNRLSLNSGYLIIFNRKAPDKWEDVGKRENISYDNKQIAIIYI